ncbi:P1 family peptidase [Luteipulveratus mongoliensis]|uniref:P1 family peptidase n=1 Tax=Luteipulveratus mongoliensis TaxID=571913 RepID=UPI000A9F1B7B
MSELKAGPTNTLTDVAGVRVGHAQRTGDGWLSGTTCVLAPDAGAVAGVDVRGGGPGTRETDLLDPRNLVERIHAIVLSGGSAYGLATASGVMDALGRKGIGLEMGEPGEVVPLVPAAVIFDLKRGGDFTKRPDAAMGEAAYDAAVASEPGAAVQQGNVGGGTGAKAGGLKGGVGSASLVLADGTTVAAIAVANPMGSPVDPQTGELYAARFGLPGEFDLRQPDPAELETALRLASERELTSGLRYGMATIIGVIATDATLTKAQCQKVAGIGHDGMARAVRPVHTMFDGDTLFAMATGERDAPDMVAFHGLLEGAADCVTRAIGHAMLAAETVEAADIRWRSYREAFPSAFA